MRVPRVSVAVVLTLSSVGASMDDSMTDSMTGVTCAERVSDGDQAVGISAVEDERCTDGGTGCFPDEEACRFCQVLETPQSSHLFTCADLESPEFDATPVPVVLIDDVPFESSVDCTALVSDGDKESGISGMAAVDPSCLANGLGCFAKDQCRYCRVRTNEKSRHLLACEIDTPVPTTTTPTSAPTNAPTDDPDCVLEVAA